ncbi:MAG: LysM domain-containing protein [Chlorobi bacterium OLB5]|nr:MAG: LysM domain-containing protein [Chlorobi bacterium OLB5]
MFAQTEKLPDELPKELNQKQWEFVRDLYAVDAIKLLAKMDTLALEIDSLKQLLIYTENFDCEAELYALVGATKEQVADYRRKFDEAESYINSRSSSPDDASKNYYNSISASKIRCLPEFSDRFVSLKNIVDNYVPVKTEKISVDEYIVAEGDNLTSIALQLYGTSSSWKLIWEANKTEIDDPDFLYPGQILKIPSKPR